jgi:modulator of FtsH protease
MELCNLGVYMPASKEDKQRKKSIRRAKLKRLYHTEHNVYECPAPERNKFISKVYCLFVLSLITGAIGAYIGIAIGHDYNNYWLLFIVEIALLIFALCVRRSVPLNFIALIAFTGFSGFTASPLLNVVIDSGKGQLIMYAFALAVAIFSILSIYVHITKKDYSWMGGFLFSSLLILLIAGVTGILLPDLLNWVIYCSISLLVFCGFVLYDTSRIIIKYDTDEYISATLDLYLDFINIFIDILRIMFDKSSDILEHVDVDIDVL